MQNICEIFVGAGAKFLKEEMKQHPVKSEVPAIARLLSPRANLCAL